MLDSTLDARYGVLDPLDASFSGDPIAISVYSGGPIDVTYLGGDCLGYASENPDYEVHYNAGLPSILRFYFIADTPGDDATLIINDTNGDWQCNDDSFGTRNPAIAFSPPESGWYDIWVGSYATGTNVAGTLYITEYNDNHP